MQHEFVTPLRLHSERQQTSYMEKITTIANSIWDKVSKNGPRKIVEDSL